MRKTVYTLNINNYYPELCDVTLPMIAQYADKIGADFEIITNAKYRHWPITYEKMQLHKLAADNDWTIFIDADTVISPSLPDFTEIIRPDHVGVHMAYDADKTLPGDYFFAKDGRNVGVVTNFMVVNRQCHDIWTPMEEDLESTTRRLSSIGARAHIIDEYCISRNLCRYGMLFTGLTQFSDQFLHLSATTEDTKAVERAKEFLNRHS